MDLYLENDSTPDTTPSASVA